MKGYLLLRDNKQTGPYSAEEIIAKGFKPYDLIWAEGKSAGWRYPGELPEFTAHAPMVEEQPFDRFFKKPSSADTKPAVAPAETVSINRIETAEVARTIQSPAKVIGLQPRKIFVTLPGTSTTPQPLQVASKPIPAEAISSVPASTSEKVVVAEKEKLEKEKNLPVNQPPAYASFQQTSQFSQDRLKPQAREEKLFEPKAGKKNSMRALLTGAIAACLLLGGVIIGLLISTTRQSSEQQQLNTLVKEIQQREASKKQMPDQPVETPPQLVSESQLQEPILAKDNEQKGNQEIINRVVNKEQIKADKKEPLKDNMVVQKDITEETSKPDTEKTIVQTDKDPVTESARQNIYSLVSVEGSTYKTGVLGGISNLQLTISNNSLYPIDQVEVRVNYMNIEQRIVKKETVIINDVAAGEQKTIPVPKSKRGVTVSYSIIKINSRALGLAKSGL